MPGPFVITCDAATARSQLVGLHGVPIDAAAMETGGHGSAYVKVWRAKPLAIFLWYHFEPETRGETWAYEKAVQAMADNHGAQWAVSRPCFAACASLPAMLDARELLPFSVLTEGERALFVEMATSKKPIEMAEDDRPLLRNLAVYGYVREVGPGMWLATSAGRKALEANRKAVLIEKLGEVAT